MHLTIAYCTARQEPMFEWFADSLCNECAGNFTDKRLVVVDFYADHTGRRPEIARKAARWPSAQFIHTAPKPTVWQGPHRLTRQDYFAASNTRNTAFCHAPDGYIVYADDVSILIPGWLTRVEAAMAGGYAAFGAYQKVSQMHVVDGVLKSCVDLATGYDSRIQALNGQRVLTPARGSWLFGCSVALPTTYLLATNGWDEDLNGMGTEDTALGMMLEMHGLDLRYDPLMMTYESEEHHHLGHTLPRPAPPVAGHASAAHAYLSMLAGGRKRAPNYFGPGGIAELRQQVLAGSPFPVCQIPQHAWQNQQPLCEL